MSKTGDVVLVGTLDPSFLAPVKEAQMEQNLFPHSRVMRL